MVCKRYENERQRTHRRKARVVLPEHFFQKPLQVDSLQIIYPVSSFAVLCCTQSLGQAYSCCRISCHPQFTTSQAQGFSQLARLHLCYLQGLSTVLSELTYWCRQSMAGLVYTSYKSSPPENAGNQRTCSFGFTCSIEKAFAVMARCLRRDAPSMKHVLK